MTEITPDADAIENASALITAPELAAFLNCDAKSLRSFIRAHRADLTPDHAHRASYSFTPADARRIAAAFTARKSTKSTTARPAAEIAALLAE